MGPGTSEILKVLSDRAGTYEGEGVNHEGRKFRGALSLGPLIPGKGLALDFKAVGIDGTVYHDEHSLLGLHPSGTLALWVLSDNHAYVTEHRLLEEVSESDAQRTFLFQCGDSNDRTSFREVISIDLWPNGEVSYRYAWGLPGGDVRPRSAARMAPRKISVPKNTESGLNAGLAIVW